MKVTSLLLHGALASALHSLGLTRAAAWCDPLRLQATANLARNAESSAPFCVMPCHLVRPA
ncbi:MAG: hypothetical protein NDI75_13345 [Candidatus Didemnitutus sp.]|nr:hypothetical protein [Candidatus Didemnitutus sp.]